MTERTYNVVTLYVRPATPSSSSVSGIRTLERARMIYEEACERARRATEPWSIPYPDNYTPPDAVRVTMWEETPPDWDAGRPAEVSCVDHAEYRSAEG